MRPTPLVLATVSVSTVAALSSWGWSVEPEHVVQWMATALFLPLLWAFVELFQFRSPHRNAAIAISSWHRTVIGGAGLLLAVGLATELAVASGLADSGWIRMGKRGQGVLLGLGMLVWGNYLPRLRSPWSPDEEPFAWQRVHRFVGWAASLGGLAILAAWMVLPFDEARLGTALVVLLVAALALGRKLVSVVTATPRPASN